MKKYIIAALIISIWILASDATTQNCSILEVHSAPIFNFVCSNATNNMGETVGPISSIEIINYTDCGCPKPINMAIANATDSSDRRHSLKIASKKVNFAYSASPNASKKVGLVHNLTELGDKLVLLDYNITVSNKANANITEIDISDTLPGNFSLGELIPGQKATNLPYPRYTITEDMIKNRHINNTANIIGRDRCCKLVYWTVSDNLLIDLPSLEKILHVYQSDILIYQKEMKLQGVTPKGISEFEGILRNQSRRIGTVSDLLHDEWSYLPDNIKTYNNLRK